jgi:GxxExxY protein
MPIRCKHPLKPLDRESSGRLSYEVYADVLAIREELGRFFDEKHYKRSLAIKRNDVALEVPVEVTHKNFSKTYFLDVLLAEGSILEFKAAERIAPTHRAQLLHYLMLTELPRGMLTNIRPERVAREYVNNVMTLPERREFQIRLVSESAPSGETLAHLLHDLLQDWGTCLELALYEEALTCLLGGEAKIVRSAKVRFEDHDIGSQVMRFADPETAFKLTALESTAKQASFEWHAQKLVNHLDIRSLLWVNLARREITIRAIHPQT